MNPAWLYGIGLAALAAFCAFKWAPKAELVTQIEINATPEQVWQLLGTPASHARWNPFIVSMQGDLIAGRRLENVLRSADGTTMRFKPRVLSVVAAQELRWIGSLPMPGLFEGEHYFELQASAGGMSTQLRHGEKFSGLLLWWIKVEKFRIDFERMNHSLKIEAEKLAKPSLDR